MSTTTYGPNAIATPANLITALRVATTPIVIVEVLHHGASWLAAGIWCVLALTDGMDGFIARRQGATRSGAFLDPLADKVMVFGVFFALVYQGRVWWVPVALMGTRELMMSFYRSIAAKNGTSIPAKSLGKAKMVAQLAVVEVVLLPIRSSGVSTVSDLLLWLATLLTIASGVQYYLDSRVTKVSSS